MSTRTIINGRIVTKDRIIDDSAVVMKDGRITDCGPRKQVRIPADTEIIDAGGNYIGPGFIDIHCHGGGGYRIEQNPAGVALAHLRHGTTGLLATIAYNISREETARGVENVLCALNGRYAGAFLGIYMEGPYINPRYGSDTSSVRLPDPEEYNRILAMAGNKIKVWALAPEIEGTDELAEAVYRNGTIIAVGHSQATAERIYPLLPRGLRLATHCMNATGITPSPSRYNGTREVGVDEAVMLCDDIYAEVICDSMGAHVRPLMLKLILKAKGVDRVVVITDATDMSGVEELHDPAAESSMGGMKASDLRFDGNGDLAGTRLTMKLAAANMMKHTGVGIVDVFKMASLNPAILLGVQDEVGSIRKGGKANIVVVTADMEVTKVIFEGEVV